VELEVFDVHRAVQAGYQVREDNCIIFKLQACWNWNCMFVLWHV